MSRVGLFVDVGNMFFNINKKWPGKKLDYDKYLQKAGDEGEVVRAVAYGTQIDDCAEKFISCLSLLGYEPKYKTVKENQWHSWDVGMSMDMMRSFERLDTIVIGNSSRPMAETVSYLVEKGCNIVALACGVPRELRQSCTKFIEVTDDMLEVKKETQIVS